LQLNKHDTANFTMQLMERDDDDLTDFIFYFTQAIMHVIP